ncbi:CBS domain-containing protein [Pseudanabaena galeata UHCC 0370]|uniref:histidine kinase n=1 Tax=Pseudanabaena galeata UHCC 0370 TaxID=3110310 RepID=A0ABU5TL64_9CYAN|nr:CBS domain-containing protein [Pseudanabaena galeata]MEA5479009.1 CBS domain-containing protein [Pseudanabaena galeata UHCC 0370]
MDTAIIKSSKLSELKSAIIREPLIVNAEATVMEAIALMSSGRAQCDAENHSDNHQQQFQQEARSSCVLVLEDEKLIGVVTERDVVRLSAQQQDLNRLLVQEVMGHPVVTMRESDLTDLLLAVNLLQQYHIRHLPLLDDRDLLVGMVTHESLRQISRPIDLMRLRLVSEVMTPDVVSAAPDRSMLEIAQMMAGQKISSVMIVETCITDISLQIPVGIVTERDVVQFQALGLNLETCIAHTVMSTPIFAVTPEDNLLTVQQIMEQRLVRRLAVTGEFGELLGIVTQTSLLQALNPIEIYNLAKVLEAKVEQLESEKVALLENRNIELELQVGITQRIRQSLDLPIIFDTACQEIQQLLQCDRVGIFKLDPDSNFDDGEFVAESVADGLFSVMKVRIPDHCFGEGYAAAYAQGRIQVVNDIDNAGLMDCYRIALTKLQVRANLVMPLLRGNNLWGLLCIHQCANTRQWQDHEINLVQQIANQLTIAIQQASLYSQSQQEIAERQQAQQQLTEANQQLARATRLKDEFLANMSHELRTPLNSILGMNEALQDEIFGSINERQLKALQTIESSSTHLLALINDILDVAKIESGQVTLELTATDLDSLCNSSLAFIKQQALTKRIQLITRIPKYLPELMLDERRIRQVLINLLNNAVKFTLEGGTITLEVSQVQLESSTTNLTPLNYIKIAVIDTGIGLSAENIQKLFQPFIQIDSALNRQYKGTGLGLALVKRLVELHGGTVELTSEVGVGSCFAINLPINIGDPAIEEQTEQDLSGQSQIGQSQTEGLISPLILLAEDNEANIATFSCYLEAKGYRILLATDGQQAIDFAKAEQPDLILMDIQMPVIDGLEAIKQIRLDPNLVNIPIIALTALAMAGDRDRCLAAGANDYLSKPVKLKQLNLLIQQVLESVK